MFVLRHKANISHIASVPVRHSYTLRYLFFMIKRPFRPTTIETVQLPIGPSVKKLFEVFLPILLHVGTHTFLFVIVLIPCASTSLNSIL